MRYLLLVAILSCTSFSTLAKYGSTIPNLPCYVNGDYIGSMLITECKEMNGDVYKKVDYVD